MAWDLTWMRESLLRRWRARSGQLLPWDTVAPPVDFEAYRRVDPVPASAWRKGSVVFAFDWAHAGMGGMSDLIHLGEALRNGHGLDVRYCIWSKQARATVVAALRFVEPGLRDEQIVQELTEPPEVLIAGVWTAAYRSLRVPAGRRIFFAQDYDALFHPAGLIHHYAREACRLPLDILTLGPWLADYIARLHPGARTRAIPFPMTDLPDRASPTRRKFIAFYIQPSKLHRGAPLLLEAARRLQPELARRYPEMEIVLFGSKDNSFAQLDFPCRSLGIIPEDAIRKLCRDSAVGVSCSFTNVSLLPFRFVSHGARALELDLPHIHANVPEEILAQMSFYAPDPDTVAATVLSALEQPPFSSADWDSVDRAYERHSWPACARSLHDWLSTG